LNKAKEEAEAKAKAEVEGWKGGRAEWETQVEAQDFEPLS
jgi:hypothetical protein